jgi:hypothetical protein
LSSLQHHFPHQLSLQQNASGAGASQIATGDKVPLCSGDGASHGTLRILEEGSGGAALERENTGPRHPCLKML